MLHMAKEKHSPPGTSARLFRAEGRAKMLTLPTGCVGGETEVSIQRAGAQCSAVQVEAGKWRSSSLTCLGDMTSVLEL